MSVTLLVRIKGKSGHGDDLAASLKPMPRENDIEGCMGWDVFRNSVDRDEFLLVETWTSVSAHKNHLATLEKAGGPDETAPHIEAVTRTYLQEAS